MNGLLRPAARFDPKRAAECGLPTKAVRCTQDIWIARRASVNDPFGAPANVSELNTANNDQPGWLSPDGCRLYLYSDRTGGVGGTDLYIAERRKDFGTKPTKGAFTVR
jgi:hypothetical protein